MINKEQALQIVNLHEQREDLETAINNCNHMYASNAESYRTITVHTHNGNTGQNVTIGRLLPIDMILGLRDQIVCKLNDRLEDVNAELKSLILSKEL